MPSMRDNCHGNRQFLLYAMNINFPSVLFMVTIFCAVTIYVTLVTCYPATKLPQEKMVVSRQAYYNDNQ